MNKKYDLAVVIGRFQPPHNGHIALFKEAISLARSVLILVGSSRIARNTKNPFTFEERVDMIRASLEQTGTNVYIEPLVDDAYNDQQWIAQVQGYVSDNTQDGDKIVLVGHHKDDSSYYLEMFQNKYEYHEFEAREELDATAFREFLFGDRVPSNKYAEFIKMIPEEVRQYLMNWIKLNKEPFEDLRQELTHLADYKKQFESLPYPPVFVTSDAVVINNGHLLLVKRRSHPGKGLWALPGGFLNPHERIKDAIIRELEEETRIKISTDYLKAKLISTQVFDAPYRSLRGRTITHAGLIILDTRLLPKVRGSDDAERAKWVPISEFYGMSDQMFEDHYSIALHMISRAGNL